MANSAQAKKRARQAEKRRQQNAGQRSAMRTAMKTVQKSVAAGDKDSAASAYQAATAAVDKAVSNGLIHKNKAARHKSRLNNQVRALG